MKQLIEQKQQLNQKWEQKQNTSQETKLEAGDLPEADAHVETFT